MKKEGVELKNSELFHIEINENKTDCLAVYQSICVGSTRSATAGIPINKAPRRPICFHVCLRNDFAAGARSCQFPD